MSTAKAQANPVGPPRVARQTCKLTEWKNPVPLATLAAAYAEIGDFEAAVD